MHISDGVLSAPVIISGTALAFAGTAIGLKKLDYDRLPMVGVLSAAFFVASLIHLPVGGASVHLVLNGVCGLLLGWAAFPAILVGLTLQALLFQHGGFTVLGVTTFNIAFPAVLLGFLCRRAISSTRPLTRWVAGFVCGAGAVALSCLAAAAVLMASDRSFWANAYSLVLMYVPAMLVEGLFTVSCVEFVRKVRPEMLPGATGSLGHLVEPNK